MTTTLHDSVNRVLRDLEIFPETKPRTEEETNPEFWKEVRESLSDRRREVVSRKGSK